ncbi:uncharacterized protein AB675_8889 [Cyphellophora attinorum]|uniref:Uncharacterized protein n=1 Tax=Cyphellophora attinorum TaxID=1664694 RepID=A0A0N1HIV9_9EURO|nr:uncharacterized protein AB675_8889 [Phialophora attinorum]KPI36156.1 hypothetical protein AB675_8889 [Phialophora attinorum]
MAKPKTMIKQSKKKSKEQVLEDADDYLAVGVDHEDAAGKWRAGDASKSLRFFNRAIEVYTQGLARYPKSLDLSYNKARVELEIATHPAMIRALDVPVRAVLEQALESHRYALQLDPENPETLFNTAQVLTTVAEELAKDEARTDVALKMLEEALELLARCYSVQEFRFEESEQQRQAMNETPQEPESSSTRESSPSVSASAAEDQWFSVVEPITADTLIDTVLAQLATLTTLTSVLGDIIPPPSSPTLPWISEYSTPLVQKVDVLTNTQDSTTTADDSRAEEITLTKTNLTTELLDASFRHSLIDLATYKTRLSELFTPPPISHPLLIAQAEALLSVSSALSLTDPPGYHADQWTALSTAISTLGTAGNIPQSTPAQQALTHSLRGDASLLQHALSFPPNPYSTAVKHAAQLLANAETFYRNATRLYLSPPPSTAQNSQAGLSIGLTSSAPDPEAALLAQRAAFRCTVAQVLQGKPADLGADLGGKIDLGGQSRAWVAEQMEEMAEEELVSEGFAEKLLGRA